MILPFLLTLFKILTIQLLAALGIFFAFGFILAKLQEKTQNNYYQTVGWKGILWTAWFGTPIHELGHVFFAKLFHHKITRVSLFKPNPETGNLGHVSHTYNKYSPYQRLGNFFVGAAPMLFGSVVLIILLYFLVPNAKEAFQPLATEQTSPLIVLISLKTTLLKLFSIANLSSWRFWLFLYLSFCVASHISPSEQDLKNMWRGFAWLIAVLIIVNLIALSVQINITRYIINLNRYLGLIFGIFTYATAISFIHLILSAIILKPFKKNRAD
ncbi:MAG: hypothetical protein A2921_00365 [Candidatus Magasanikbacteria bacterium RIFCSPLOWO2_01_FULL_43_20b]|uniref:Uncharacterized protein n=1 Tax=Candidatus Magasanikbacteria bacterium RIFCSPLOWO2_12_FULL_43_12 TaxID=1798692 RepID=A0A1F6MS71_9BACT|nr:MAG: hypothetical protein A2921_00365 [Candidatus Magasanikbacteria bacterium RIFCSPLOWO2_01_FULL_43_20b]OGH74398.1 MAG: hypothetical protein A3G00_04475 [Candidatus Magasanikbacteria bacterium RIFCSPLOWO2_12_FULL_43_12]